jgi:hypothetical protein
MGNVRDESNRAFNDNPWIKIKLIGRIFIE